MNDTSPETAAYLDDIYKNKSGEEKLLMALSMYETARELVIASLAPGLSKKELVKELFLRFYGNDFNEEEKKKILAKLG